MFDKGQGLPMLGDSLYTALPMIANSTDKPYSGFVDPYLMITKECPMCEQVFESPVATGKKYCSTKCRRRAKKFRESRRTKTLHISAESSESIFLFNDESLLADLKKFDALVASEQSNDKPVRFCGLIPEPINLRAESSFRSNRNSTRLQLMSG